MSIVRLRFPHYIYIIYIYMIFKYIENLVEEAKSSFGENVIAAAGTI